MNAYQFYRKRPPPLKDYLWVLAAATPALFLSGISVWDWFHPAIDGVSTFDRYGMWFIASVSWLLPVFFWSTLTTRRKQFRDHMPVLIVDQNGISITDWRGRMFHRSWTELELERVQRHGEDDLWMRGGGVSGAISLIDLDQPADQVVEIINRFSRSAA